MAKSCCLTFCHSNKARNENLSFYMIPNEATEPHRRTLWLQAIQREDVNGKLWHPKSDYHFVCSKHFVEEADQRSGKACAKLSLTRYARKQKREENKAIRPPKKQFQPEKNNNVIPGTSVPPGKSFEITETVTSLDEEAPICDKKYSTGESVPAEVDNLTNDDDKEGKKNDCPTEARKEDNDFLQNTTIGALLHSSSVQGDDKKCKMLTGLSWGTFEVLYDFMKQHIKPCSSSQPKVPMKEQLFITLIKLQQNPSLDLICHLIGVARSTFFDIFSKWLNLLYAKISFLLHWPDREVMFRAVPPLFRARYP
eukprot:gene13390-14763_t